MQSPRSLIALLTDFGTKDPYVAAMKGVIAARCDAEIVDLTHQIEPYDLLEAAAFLHAALPWLPQHGFRYERVVVTCVVDPGVGSDRRIAVIERDGRWLVAPDNGILSGVCRGGAAVLCHETPWDLPHVSRTFHGRDRFAPLSAALARGETPSGPLKTLLPLDAWPALEHREGQVTGTVIAIDRFGNCITDIDAVDHRTGWSMRTPDGGSVSDWAATYEGMTPGRPYLLEGSRGTIEVSVKQASAADLLQLSPGDRVRIERVD